MQTSALFHMVYVKDQHRWTTPDDKNLVGVTQHVEVTVWSLLSVFFVLAIVLIFISHVALNTDTAIILTILYSYVCMLMSNEYIVNHM
jgi:hypothetical protein